MSLILKMKQLAVLWLVMSFFLRHLIVALIVFYGYFGFDVLFSGSFKAFFLDFGCLSVNFLPG